MRRDEITMSRSSFSHLHMNGPRSANTVLISDFIELSPSSRCCLKQRDRICSLLYRRVSASATVWSDRSKFASCIHWKSHWSQCRKRRKLLNVLSDEEVKVVRNVLVGPRRMGSFHLTTALGRDYYVTADVRLLNRRYSCPYLNGLRRNL